MPGEAEKAAEFLGLKLKTFFRRYLAIDYWTSNPEDIFVLSPAVKGRPPGGMFPFDPRGECVFFQKGLCEINDVKPYECRMAHHDNKTFPHHKKVAIAWRKLGHQKQLESFLEQLEEHYQEHSEIYFSCPHCKGKVMSS